MKKNSGFTLIEVMVATTILLLMTVMMGALFRQASSAWDAGNAQAEGGMIVRGVVGAITRDLATAVDARDYPDAGLGNKAFSCETHSLTFVCLKPVTEGFRVPHKIIYDVGSTVKRRDAKWDASSSSFGEPKESTLFDGDAAGFSARFSLEALDMPDTDKTNPSSSDSDRDDWEDDDFVWNGPPAVKVKLTLTQDGSFSGLSVRSWGPNGEPGSPAGKEDDDIVVN